MKRCCLFLSALIYLFIAACGDEPTAPPTLTPVPPSPPPTVTMTPTPPIVTTLADVILHSAPSFSAGEVGQVPRQSPVSLLGVAIGQDCGDWVLVRAADGTEGWTAPVLVNVDPEKSVIAPALTPTPLTPLMSVSDTCSADLALVKIDNVIGKNLQAFVSGAEPAITFSIDTGETLNLCIAPGEYCFFLTDGEKKERGNLKFEGGICACWHWGSEASHPALCDCSDDPGDYQRP